MDLNQLRQHWSRLSRQINRFTWGGAWAASLSAIQRQNLTHFFYDGLFSAASDKIILTYMTIYLLTLGVTRQQIGFLSSFSNFVNALLLLPAAFLVEYSGARKEITVKSAIASRMMVLLMAILPFFLFGTTTLVWIMLALFLLREAANNFAFPGWMALTGDMIPLEGRGRYFGTRNFIMGLAGIFAALVIGEAITQIGSPIGYQFAYLLAAVLGGVAILFFMKLNDPHPGKKPDPQPTEEQVQEPERFFQGFLRSLTGIITSIKQHPHFINFAIYVAAWNFSINIAAPFFNVYMVDTLYMTAAMIGVTTVSNTAANMLVQRRVGLLADKWGNRIVTIIFLFLIPFLPLFWGIWVRQYWHALVIHTIGGLLWGGFNLVSFNNLLMQTPEDQRARFSAYYQIIVTLSLSAGAALGSFLIPKIDFTGVTLTSAAGRWIAAFLFVFLVGKPARLKKVRLSD
ncbi:MAG: MFS transporter [Brevefilum sp.]|nr:MFS transporter [Brevefilum sp.]